MQVIFGKEVNGVKCVAYQARGVYCCDEDWKEKKSIWQVNRRLRLTVFLKCG